ncbi:MAG: DUF2231 domain-containing protein [Pseudoxanthomonas sp.]
MSSMLRRAPAGAIHPFHAVMLAGSVPLFLGVLLADYAYWSSFQIEWSNFASWLIIGALLFGAIALLCAVIDLFRGGGSVLYSALLAATWVLGFCNALIHAKDAWAIMPTALILSAVSAVLACVATWIGFRSLRAGVAK